MKKNTVVLVVLLSLSFFSVCFAVTAQNVANQTDVFQVLKVNLHAHTTYSDGTYTPAQLVNIYKDAGYDVLAVTDHSTVAGYAEAASEGEKIGLTVVCGEEVTCSWPDGSYKHVIALFTNQSVGFAEDSDVEIPVIFDSIHAQNGIGIVAHAWFSWNNWQNYQDESYIDGWEIDQSMAWTLESGCIYMLGHDFHNETWLQGISNYWTYLLAENRTEAAVTEALVNGRILVYGNGTLYGSAYALNLYAQNQELQTPSPTPSTKPTPIPTLTPASTVSPMSTPTNAPTSNTESTPTPEPTRTQTNTILPEAVYAAAALGVPVVAATIVVTLKKQKERQKTQST
jgi:hypothetical protein